MYGMSWQYLFSLIDLYNLKFYVRQIIIAIMRIT